MILQAVIIDRFPYRVAVKALFKTDSAEEIIGFVYIQMKGKAELIAGWILFNGYFIGEPFPDISGNRDVTCFWTACQALEC